MTDIDGARSRRLRPIGRRTVLKAAVALGLALPVRAHVPEQESDRSQARPQENDRFVFAFGSREGEIIRPADVALGEPQIVAYPMEPTSDVVRSGSRLNQVILVRLDPDDLTEETRTRAADGIVAYSAVCTHTGCDVADWVRSVRHFLCPCHDSEFDPSDAARVDTGPAPRRLAALPLKIVDGALVAAGGFIGRVGAAEQ